MLRSRVTPCLLVQDGGLVKTVKFKDSKYVGDPINAVRIFNEKEADELIVLDIDASVNNAEPDYKMIEHLAKECRMPLCYGGGIKTLAHAEKIVALGVEKVALSSVVFDQPSLIVEIANKVGRQSDGFFLDGIAHQRYFYYLQRNKNLNYSQYLQYNFLEMYNQNNKNVKNRILNHQNQYY